MGKKSPDTPDYKGAAEATAESSREVTADQTFANRPTQVNPFGRVDWENTPVYDPASGATVNEWTQTQTLDPNLQAALDSQIDLTRGRSELGAGMMGRIADEFGDQMDWDQFGDQATGVRAERIDMSDLPGGVGSLDYSGAPELGTGAEARTRAEEAIYGRQASRLDPQYEQRSQALESKLINQGLRPGDEAYDAAMGNFERDRTDAYSSANLDAIAGGGAEASRTFGMDAARRGISTGETDRSAAFANRAREQALAEQIRVKDRGYAQETDAASNANQLRMNAINEELQSRGTSLNEVNALISGQQVNTPQMAGIPLASRSAATDYTGATQDAYAADLNRANASNMAIQGMMGGATSLATGGFF